MMFWIYITITIKFGEILCVQQCENWTTFFVFYATRSRRFSNANKSLITSELNCWNDSVEKFLLAGSSVDDFQSQEKVNIWL